MIELTCPLTGLDLETTGRFPRVDRIVQVATIRLEPGGGRREFRSLVNPGVPIPPETTAVHGIKDEMVKDAPRFAELAPRLAEEFRNTDWFGYHVHFDLEVIRREFERAGVQAALDGRVIDASALWRHQEPRTLAGAVRRFLGEDHSQAHDAGADIAATERVLQAQLQAWPELPRTAMDLDALLNAWPEDWATRDGMLVWRYGEAALAFSGHAGKRLRKVPKGFLRWVLRKDFSQEVKDACRAALDGRYLAREGWNT